MPLQEGSCLNEEYTEIVTRIYNLLKEAKEKYDSLPISLRKVETAHERGGGHKLGWYLTNGEGCAYCFAKEFGIEVDK